MDNDIEYGNIEVKYYLSCVSETPLWNSGVGIPGTAYSIVDYIQDRLTIVGSSSTNQIRSELLGYGLPALTADSLLSAVAAGKNNVNLASPPSLSTVIIPR